MNGEPLLELRDVHAAYGRIEVLHGIDLVVLPGRVCAVLGPNGTGKTTTLRVAAGLHRPTSGDLLVAGRLVDGARPDDLARRGLCLVPEGRGVFPNLTVREHLRMATHLGCPLDELEEQTYTRFHGLADRRNQLAGTLSGGEQQMLAIARALASRPALLLLDELSMGLAPLIVEELYEHVAGIARQGVAVVLVEQFARTVLGIADDAVIMSHGRVARAGPPAELGEVLSEVYLGA